MVSTLVFLVASYNSCCVDLPHSVSPIISEGPFGLFLPLAIVEGVATNICAQVFVYAYFLFLLGIHLGVELLGPAVTLCHFNPSDCTWLN